MSPLEPALSGIRARIVAACAAAARPVASVQLLAVSKSVDADRLREAHAAGLHVFGENYAQEALIKIGALADLAPEWHFIGPIQSNKTADIARHFAWVHGVDRLRIAQRLSAARAGAPAPLNVCVQVNVSGEASKSGCTQDDTPALCAAIARLPHLRLRGLMAIPAPATHGADPRAPYRVLHELFEHIRAQGLALDTISAGMSDDFEAAIAEGSTLIRVGTALFGARNRTNS